MAKSELKIRHDQDNAFYYEQSVSGTIRENFNNVESIELNLHFKYDEIDTHNKKTLNGNDKSFFKLKCVNKDCIHGGFNLTGEIYEAIRTKSSSMSGHMTCDGWQDYERFQARNHHCLCELQYEVAIKYK
mgnify:CR=1 FL=1